LTGHLSSPATGGKRRRSTSPDLSPGNSFQNNALCAQTFNGFIPPTIRGASRGCTGL
jgi:hypothetical protein